MMAYEELTSMSLLSIEDSDDGADADTETSCDNFSKHTDKYKNNNTVSDDDEGCFRMDWASSVTGPASHPWAKEYWTMRRRRRRRRWVDRAWEMKRSMCRVVVRPRGPDSESICMDMDEVKACRELGLELPSDWTVEIPCGISGVDTSSGADSPNWNISSPGSDPKDVKARLRMWAQAVALASASSLSG